MILHPNPSLGAGHRRRDAREPEACHVDDSAIAAALAPDFQGHVLPMPPFCRQWVSSTPRDGLWQTAHRVRIPRNRLHGARIRVKGFTGMAAVLAQRAFLHRKVR